MVCKLEIRKEDTFTRILTMPMETLNFGQNCNGLREGFFFSTFFKVLLPIIFLF